MERPHFGIPKTGGITAKPPGIRSVLAVVGGLALLLAVWNLWFTVEPEEVGIVLRFGKFTREVPPGLHFKLPDPLETVFKVPVQRQLKEEFGFRTVEEFRPADAQKVYEQEALMLTGDLNVAWVEWSTQYRIKDPYLFLFRIKDVRNTFRDLNEAVMKAVVGDRTVNNVLTVGRQEISDEVKKRLQGLCDQYETGITVDQVVLQNVTPPEPVKPSFNEVNQAQQEKERLINEAWSEYNKAIPRARGEALQLIQNAEGYAAERINRAKGDAAFFEALYKAYQKAPEVTRKRLYIETIEAVFPRVNRTVVMDESARNLLPLLNLDTVEVKP
ncbi:MAG: FtsH protease activity modulator HflK [Deltaproteobacteria bacterium]